jgi:DnaK suppressor protein
VTRKQLIQKIKTILTKRRDALRRSLAAELELCGISEGRSHGDFVDAAVETDAAGIASQLAEVESRELKQIEDALERIRDGSYGFCESCGKKIAMARLTALPYTPYCIRCQRAAERGDAAPQSIQRRWPLGGIEDSSSEVSLDLAGLGV